MGGGAAKKLGRSTTRQCISLKNLLIHERHEQHNQTTETIVLQDFSYLSWTILLVNSLLEVSKVNENVIKRLTSCNNASVVYQPSKLAEGG